MEEELCDSCLYWEVVEIEPKILGICLNTCSAFFNCNTFADCHCKEWEEIDLEI